jgi:hypothetical protein
MNDSSARGSRIRSVRAIPSLLLAASLLGCGTDPGPAVELVGTIGPEGGSLVSLPTSALGGVSLVIPEGALAAPTEIAVRFDLEAHAPLPNGGESCGLGYRIEPDGLELAVPAEWSLPVDLDLLARYAQPLESVKVWSHDGSAWSTVTDVTAQDERAVMFRTSRFGAAAPGVGVPTQTSPTCVGGSCVKTCDASCLSLVGNSAPAFAIRDGDDLFASRANVATRYSLAKGKTTSTASSNGSFMGAASQVAMSGALFAASQNPTSTTFGKFILPSGGTGGYTHFPADFGPFPSELALAVGLTTGGGLIELRQPPPAAGAVRLLSTTPDGAVQVLLPKLLEDSTTQLDFRVPPVADMGRAHGLFVIEVSTPSQAPSYRALTRYALTPAATPAASQGARAGRVAFDAAFQPMEVESTGKGAAQLLTVFGFRNLGSPTLPVESELVRCTADAATLACTAPLKVPANVFGIALDASGGTWLSLTDVPAVLYLPSGSDGPFQAVLLEGGPLKDLAASARLPRGVFGEAEKTALVVTTSGRAVRVKLP